MVRMTAMTGARWMRTTLGAELPPVGSEELVFGRLRPRSAQRMNHAGDIQKMAVVQVVRDAVAAPCSASHGQREGKAVVEAAAGRKAMRLIDDHPAYRQRKPKRQRARVVLAVESHRVPRTLVAQDVAGDHGRVREIARAVHGK